MQKVKIRHKASLVQVFKDLEVGGMWPFVSILVVLLSDKDALLIISNGWKSIFTKCELSDGTALGMPNQCIHAFPYPLFHAAGFEKAFPRKCPNWASP